MSCLSSLTCLPCLSCLPLTKRSVTQSVTLCRYKAAGAAKKTIRNVVTLDPAQNVVAMQSIEPFFGSGLFPESFLKKDQRVKRPHLEKSAGVRVNRPGVVTMDSC